MAMQSFDDQLYDSRCPCDECTALEYRRQGSLNRRYRMQSMVRSGWQTKAEAIANRAESLADHCQALVDPLAAEQLRLSGEINDLIRKDTVLVKLLNSKRKLADSIKQIKSLSYLDDRLAGAFVNLDHRDALADIDQIESELMDVRSRRALLCQQLCELNPDASGCKICH